MVMYANLRFARLAVVGILFSAVALASPSPAHGNNQVTHGRNNMHRQAVQQHHEEKAIHTEHGPDTERHHEDGARAEEDAEIHQSLRVPMGDSEDKEENAPEKDSNELQKQGASMIKDAHALQERLLIVEKLLKLKETQVRDAVDTSIYYNDAYKANIAKIKQLNRLVETSKKGDKAILADLRKKSQVEKMLREKLEKDEDMLERLEKSLSSAKRAASDPTLSQWIRRRVETLAAMIQDDASARVLGRVVGEAVDDTRNSFIFLESQVEGRIHNKGLAIFACFLVMLFPALAVRWAFSHVTKALSYRQHVLLANLFNFFLLSSLIAAIAIMGQDPMVTIRKLSPHYFVIVQVFFVVQWPIMLFLLIHTTLSSTTNQEGARYMAQLALLGCLIIHVVTVARTNILMKLSDVPSSNLKNYVLYDLCVAVMLVLTLTGPRSRSEGLVREVSDIVHKGVGDAVQFAMGDESFKTKPDIEKRRFIRVDADLSMHDAKGSGSRPSDGISMKDSDETHKSE